VVPICARAWFHDQLAPALLSKQVLDAHDLQAQWNSARAALAPPIARGRNAAHYMPRHGARILFGTDTPSAPHVRESAGTERMARNATHGGGGNDAAASLSRRHAGYSNLNGALMLGTALIRKS